MRRKPCRICGHWFWPHPRAGQRQGVCSGAACQRERHLRACKIWRERESEGIRAHRLRQQIRVPEKVGLGLPSQQLDWDAVRDAVSLQVAVIVEEVVRVVETQLRDAVSRQSYEFKEELGRHLSGSRRDDMLNADASP